MLAASIPDGYLIAMMAVSLPATIALMAWIVRELSRISTQSAVLEARQDQVEHRLDQAGI